MSRPDEMEDMAWYDLACRYKLGFNKGNVTCVRVSGPDVHVVPVFKPWLLCRLVPPEEGCAKSKEKGDAEALDDGGGQEEMKVTFGNEGTQCHAADAKEFERWSHLVLRRHVPHRKRAEECCLKPGGRGGGTVCGCVLQGATSHARRVSAMYEAQTLPVVVQRELARAITHAYQARQKKLQDTIMAAAVKEDANDEMDLMQEVVQEEEAARCAVPPLAPLPPFACTGHAALALSH